MLISLSNRHRTVTQHTRVITHIIGHFRRTKNFFIPHNHLCITGTCTHFHCSIYGHTVFGLSPLTVESAQGMITRHAPTTIIFRKWGCIKYRAQSTRFPSMYHSIIRSIIDPPNWVIINHPGHQIRTLSLNTPTQDITTRITQLVTTTGGMGWS